MKKPNGILPNIVICILMDLVGYASFVIPGLGGVFRYYLGSCIRLCFL